MRMKDQQTSLIHTRDIYIYKQTRNKTESNKICTCIRKYSNKIKLRLTETFFYFVKRKRN